jgi:hypothetical protein
MKNATSQNQQPTQREKRPKRDITCTYVAELELFAKEWVLVWCVMWATPARAHSITREGI